MMQRRRNSTTKVDLSIVNQSAKTQDCRFFSSVEIRLLRSKPPNFCFGDDSGTQGFKKHFSNDHDGNVTDLLHYGGFISPPCVQAFGSCTLRIDCLFFACQLVTRINLLRLISRSLVIGFCIIFRLINSTPMYLMAFGFSEEISRYLV